MEFGTGVIPQRVEVEPVNGIADEAEDELCGRLSVKVCEVYEHERCLNEH
jgi:hypothetical protein